MSGTFQIGEWGREYGDENAKPFRQNDGTLIVSRGADDDGQDRQQVLIPRIVKLKRSQPYDTPDAEQMAFARRVVALLNIAERGDVDGLILAEIAKQPKFAEQPQ